MADVFLFGAGASKEYAGNYGPLFCDKEFFPVLEHLNQHWSVRDGIDQRPEHYDGSRWDWSTLRESITEACPEPLATLSLETAFSTMAATGRVNEDLFCRAIELALFWKIRGHAAEHFPTHVTFLNRVLSPGATLVTFNYDPALEFTLEALASGLGVRWSPWDGYGFRWNRELASDGTVRDLAAGESSNVRLLKLHGSMNWMVPAEGWPNRPEFLLRLQKYGGPGFRCIREGERGRTVRPLFVPPKQAKNYAVFGLDDLWRQAEGALRAAESLHVIGYSFPKGDEAARSLMEIAAGRLGDSKRVTLVTKGPLDWDGFEKLFPQATVFDRGFGEYVRQMGDESNS